jgi:hypothetical protein
MIGTLIMEKPDKPAPNECCGGGSCCPCVWDDYFAKLKCWQEEQDLSDVKKLPTPADKK